MSESIMPKVRAVQFIKRNWLDLLLGCILFLSLFDILSHDMKLTWDGPGHYVQLKIFSNLGKSFLAEGYSNEWFGGYPAFRYYAGYFYFLGSIPIWTGLDLSQALQIIVLFSVILWILGYLFFISYFLKNKFIWIALFFYLGFQGPSPMGVSLVGILGGNYTHTLGMAWGFLSLGFLIRKRFFEAFVFLTILSFTHYLNFVFFSILTIFFLIENYLSYKMFRSLPWNYLIVLILVPISFWGILLNPGESLAEPQFAYYPFLETILGGLSNQSLGHIFIASPLSIFPIFMLWGYLKTFKTNNTLAISILPWLSILFLFMTQDISFSRMFPNMGIHWYRSWDFFYSLFAALSAYGFSKVSYSKNLSYILLGLSLFFFLIQTKNINKEMQEIDQSSQLLQKSFSLDKINSLIDKNYRILLETTTHDKNHKLPHFSIIEYMNLNLPVDNGLMVESSLTPFLQRIYLPISNRNDFQWGFTDPRLKLNLPLPSKLVSERFLWERNIGYIDFKSQGFNKNFSNILLQNPSKDNFIPQKIIGVLSENSYYMIKKDLNPKDYLLEGFLLTESFPDYYFLDISAHWNLNSKIEDFPILDEIWILNLDRHEIVHHLKSSKGCTAQIERSSYYPTIELKGIDSTLFRTQFNTIAYCSDEKNRGIVEKIQQSDSKGNKLTLPPLLGYLKFIIYCIITLFLFLYTCTILKKKIIFIRIKK